jgi:hypothetical protein
LSGRWWSWSRALCLAGLAACLGCEAGVRGRTGLEAWLRASNATFVDQPISTAADPTLTAGPRVMISRYPSVALPGQINQTFSGNVQQGGRSVAVGLQDDRAYWIVPAPSANQEVGSMGELLFSSSLSFSPLIPSGAHNLIVRAIDAEGRMGDLLIAPIMISGFTNVRGVFQIKLAWDTNADLDLHVTVPVNPADLSDPSDPKAPTRIEVWANQPSSLPPRPTFDPYPPEHFTEAGLLDYDSNGGCVIDGRREENLVWGAPPLPAGHYVVRVDTVSLCGEVAAQWQVTVFKDGAPLSGQIAFGESVDGDTRFSHTQGAGVQALEFDLP